MVLSSSQLKNQLDPRLPTPLYYQLQKIIQKSIDEGLLQPGEKLPSERELAKTYDINRLTVRQATNALVNKGVLVRKRGLGTFVAQAKLNQGLFHLTSFTEDMISRGLKPATLLLSFSMEAPEPQVQEELNLHPGEKIYLIERLRLASQEPMAREISFLPFSLFPGMEKKDLEHGSLYNLLRKKFNLTLGRARETLEAVAAEKTEADLLGISPGTPVFLRERLTHTEQGEPFEFVRSFYRADRYKFFFYLER